MASPLAFFVRAWYEDAGWLYLLRPLEWCYRGAMALRSACYRQELVPSFRPAKPVVIVGNLTVGGTGKTPVVIALVEALHRRGIRAGVVGRGYGARGAAFPHSVTRHSTPGDCGDELLLIHRRTGCPCIAAPARVAAVQMLLRDYCVDIVICDDGLQHYALQRDLEIVLYDAQLGFGNGRCLPAGPLREPVQRLRTADFVLARHGGRAGVIYRLDGLVNVMSGEVRDASSRALGADVHAMAGIGQPGQFFSALRRLGFTPSIRVFPDHHHYRARDLSGLDDRPVLMTEKDAVKCRALVGDNAWYLKVSAILPETVVDAVAALARS